MENTTVKLKVKSQALNNNTKEQVKNKFIQACINLDASILEPLINDEQYFQDLDKYRFLQSLKNEFTKAKDNGALTTTLIKGECRGCQREQATYQFYGNSTRPEFSYIIYNREDVFDIFICNLSSGRIENNKTL